jgi:hypothetical protein
VFLVSAPAAWGAIWRRVGGLVLLQIFFVALQRHEMSFWFDLLPRAAMVQFPARLLVQIVIVAILCAAIATEMALRSTVPFVRVAARILPVVGAVCQGNVARGTQSAIWGRHVERDVVDAAMFDESDVANTKLSMYTSWDDFLPRRHGNSPAPSPFLTASEGCFISSPRLTGRGRAPLVVQDSQCNDLKFTVSGKSGCTVKLNQFHSSLLRIDVSPSGGAQEADDGTTVIDVPQDGSVVRLRERGVLDLARKWLIEKARRFP